MIHTERDTYLGNHRQQTVGGQSRGLVGLGVNDLGRGIGNSLMLMVRRRCRRDGRQEARVTSSEARSSSATDGGNSSASHHARSRGEHGGRLFLKGCCCRYDELFVMCDG